MQSNTPAAVKAREYRERMKALMVESMGGRCVCCGYSAHHSALDFHHLDPKTKKYNLAKTVNIAWHKRVRELRKCVLVCATCHREIEAGVRDVPANATRFNEDYAVISTPTKVTTACLVCGEQTYNDKYCSPGCSSKAQRAIEWSRLDISALLTQYGSYVKIGTALGVSDRTVAKWHRKQLAR